MSENTSGSEVGRRLRKLPGQFVLALINATSILVIVAAVLVIVAFNRVESVAENIATTMTQSVLAEFNLGDRQLINRINEVRTEVTSLVTAIGDEREAITQAIDDQREMLNEAIATGREDLIQAIVVQRDEMQANAQERLDAFQAELVMIRTTVQNIETASGVLLDAAIKEMGDAITDGIIGLRRCELADTDTAAGPAV